MAGYLIGISRYGYVANVPGGEWRAALDRIPGIGSETEKNENLSPLCLQSGWNGWGALKQHRFRPTAGNNEF